MQPADGKRRRPESFHLGLESMRHLFDGQLARVDDTQVQRVGLSTKVGSPGVHTGGSQFRMAASSQASLSDIGAAVQKNDTSICGYGTGERRTDKRRSCLAVKHAHGPTGRVGCELRDPALRTVGLPSFRPPELTVHDLERGDANAIEVEAPNSGPIARLDHLDGRRLPGAGRARDDEDRRPTHAFLPRSLMPSRPNVHVERPRRANASQRSGRTCCWAAPHAL
jgi:hypothetical protein